MVGLSSVFTMSQQKHSDSSEHNIDEEEEARETYKQRDACFSSYASSKDLRCFDMAKERLDGSSPRGALEAFIESLEPNKDPPRNSSSESHVHCSNTRVLSHWRKFFRLWRKKSMKRLTSFSSIGIPKISRRSRSSRETIPPGLSELYHFRSSLKDFSLFELQKATNNFNAENLIGKGGYAEVYKGHLPDGQLVAVKVLTKGSIEEKIAAFLSELGIIAHVNHRNTAKLIGSGVEGGMHLVFQLSPLGSLGSLLHGSEGEIDWSKRYKVSVGTAEGLQYLHDSCERRIIHRDIKADNILLTADFEPQICDFGLAKWLPRQWSHHNVSTFEGTFGYFAPEYFMHGIVDEKTDVYSFGVFLLEIITGRRALDSSQQNLVIWAKPFIEKNDIRGLVDPSLGDNYDLEELNLVVLTASFCIRHSPLLRPRMSEVVILLKGDKQASNCTKKCQARFLKRTYSVELMDAQEYNSTRYLNDLNRHKEVALGY